VALNFSHVTAYYSLNSITVATKPQMLLRNSLKLCKRKVQSQAKSDSFKGFYKPVINTACINFCGITIVMVSELLKFTDRKL